MLDLISDSSWPLPVLGLIIGMVMGAAARWSHFCTLTSLERYWYGGDSRGVRTWSLAIGTAILLTQMLVLTGLVDVTDSYHLNPEISIVTTLVGGILFGLGMALVGTCAFGALIRLGSGSLRSLIVLMVIALFALATQRGALSGLRETVFQSTSIQFKGNSSSISNVLSVSPTLVFVVALIIASVFFLYSLSDVKFRSEKKHITAGVVIGSMVALGWFVTYQMREVMFVPVQIESASFVLPPGELLNTLIVSGIPDYGVGMTVGVVAGAALVANLTRDVHWEACDDTREFSRHLFGAICMGIGGIMAAGCTIGQGISAFSLLSLSAPIAILGIAIGARVGLKLLMEGIPSPYR